MEQDLFEAGGVKQTLWVEGGRVVFRHKSSAKCKASLDSVCGPLIYGHQKLWRKTFGECEPQNRGQVDLPCMVAQPGFLFRVLIMVT